MFKLNNGSQVLMAFLITINLLANASGQVRKCAAVGEYCQNHWECCSNSCMSYLYKCVRNYNIYPYTFLSYEPPRRTIEDILELNFGVNNYFRPNAVPQPIGVYGQLLSANEIVPNNQVLEFVDLETPIIRPTTADIAARPTIATVTATTAFQTVQRLGGVDEIVPTTTATSASPSIGQSTSSTATAPAADATSSTITSSSTTTTPPAKCSEIGVKCFRNDECCTQRCHGFLHQCVT